MTADRSRSASARGAPAVPLAELWAGVEKLIVPAGSSPATRQQARQAFYAGIMAVIGQLSEALESGDAKETRKILDRIGREINTDAAERATHRTIWK
jgi:hypothetical protein